MKRGFVVGKFYPPHRGHHYLIDTALSQVDYLYVAVVDSKNQTIPATLRAKWLREIHPNADVHVIDDIYADDDSKAWAEHTIKTLGYRPDVVFTSEEYGTAWAEYLECDHVQVDQPRLTYPVSGTKVRHDPLSYWRYLSPPVRAYFARRVCVIGAESTGTTTLAHALAEHYQTNWVPEYGRFYTEGKLLDQEHSAEWLSHEFKVIADLQNRTEDELARTCNKVLFCDTDAFATELWHERYMEYSSPAVRAYSENRSYGLYIVTAPDIPFVQDGLRDGEHIRQQMHKRFIEELKQRNKPYIIVRGSINARLNSSIKHIDALLSS